MTYTNINTIVKLEENVKLVDFLNELEKDELVYELRPITLDTQGEKIPLSYDEHEAMFEIAIADQVVLVKLHSELTTDGSNIHSMDIFSTVNGLTNIKEFDEKMFTILARTLNVKFKMVIEFSGYGTSYN